VLNVFYKISQARYFWLAGAFYLLLMEAIALYYQYVLEYYPCALCVQIRAWVSGAIILSIGFSFVSEHLWWRWTGLTLTTTLVGGALYTSWYAFGVENGTVLSSCTMGAGFPEFMPLDQWIPWLFSAQGMCGRSPDMWFGLTMNEGLLISLSIPAFVLLAQWLLHIRYIFFAVES